MVFVPGLSHPVEIDLPPGGSLRLRVNGDSMQPCLKRGDVVHVVAAAGQALTPGDVIVVRRANDLVTHRIITRSAEDWITKGDASRQADLPVAAAAVLGRVEAVERNGKVVGLAAPAMRRRARRAAWASRCESAAWQATYDRFSALPGHPDRTARVLAAGVSLPFRLAVRLLARFG